MKEKVGQSGEVTETRNGCKDVRLKQGASCKQNWGLRKDRPELSNMVLSARLHLTVRDDHVLISWGKRSASFGRSAGSVTWVSAGRPDPVGSVTKARASAGQSASSVTSIAQFDKQLPMMEYMSLVHVAIFVSTNTSPTLTNTSNITNQHEKHQLAVVGNVALFFALDQCELWLWG
jgi:hypothetical protein